MQIKIYHAIPMYAIICMILVVSLPVLLQDNTTSVEPQENYYKFSILGVYQNGNGAYCEFYIKAYNQTHAMTLSHGISREVMQLNNLTQATVRYIGNSTGGE